MDYIYSVCDENQNLLIKQEALQMRNDEQMAAAEQQREELQHESEGPDPYALAEAVGMDNEADVEMV